MQFEFATAAQITFGAGKAREIGAFARTLGRRAMVVTGCSPERAEIIREQLSGQRIGSIVFSVPGEPTTDIALDGAQKAREAACDWVVGIGGGSVIDTGKVIAALITNNWNQLGPEYLRTPKAAAPVGI